MILFFQTICVLVIVIGIPYACYLVFLIFKDVQANFDVLTNGMKTWIDTYNALENLPGAIHPKDCTCWLCKPPALKEEECIHNVALSVCLICSPKKTLVQTITGRNAQSQFTPYSYGQTPHWYIQNVSTFTGVEEIK